MALTQLLDNSDGYSVGRSPEILETKGAFPCAIVAIYDPRRKIGVLGHFASPGESQNFKSMIEWITANLKPGNLEITLSGVSTEHHKLQPHDKGAYTLLAAINNHMLLKREYLVITFLRLGVKPNRIKERFPARPNTGTDVSFYTSDGKVDILHYGLSNVL